jgi:hypothetical protein
MVDSYKRRRGVVQMHLNLLKKNLLLGAISISLILCLTVTGVGGVPSDAIVAIEPRYNYYPASTEFTINLTVIGAEDIQSWEANVTFDPAVLEVVTCAEGEFLKRKGFPTDFLFDIRSERILLSAAYLMIGPPGLGITGDGQLANITFHVKTDTTVTLIDLDEDYTTLTYNNGTAPALQPCVLHPARFAIPGDVDGDGDVDPFDFSEFRVAYGSKGLPQVPTPDPNHNYWADLDGDGDVDPFDFSTFRVNYGSTM